MFKRIKQVVISATPLLAICITISILTSCGSKKDVQIVEVPKYNNKYDCYTANWSTICYGKDSVCITDDNGRTLECMSQDAYDNL